jgi:hypothetical protein
MLYALPLEKFIRLTDPVMAVDLIPEDFFLAVIKYAGPGSNTYMLSTEDQVTYALLILESEGR